MLKVFIFFALLGILVFSLFIFSMRVSMPLLVGVRLRRHGRHMAGMKRLVLLTIVGTPYFLALITCIPLSLGESPWVSMACFFGIFLPGSWWVAGKDAKHDLSCPPELRLYPVNESHV
jgi:hypothetical protein